MGYYHTDQFQRAAARETRRQGFERWHQDVLDSIQSRRADRQNPGSSARFDAVSRAYENAWKTPGTESQQKRSRRNDSDRVDLKSAYENAWKG